MAWPRDGELVGWRGPGMVSSWGPRDGAWGSRDGELVGAQGWCLGVQGW